MIEIQNIMPCHIYLFFKTTHFMTSQKNDLIDFCDKNTLCDALVCKDGMFASRDFSSYLCAPVTNHLQKYHDTQRSKPTTAFHQER